MQLPPYVTRSGLYARVSEDAELLSGLAALRAVTERLADAISRSVPAFTDHSVRHMDALWGVVDRVLTPTEISALTPAEAFLLSSGFYLHDIGMAYAATEEGLSRCRASKYYQLAVASAGGTEKQRDVEALAIAMAVRRMHASAALELATDVVPGTEIHLFESLGFREAWGQTCGQIAASHHWGLDRVEHDLGTGGTVPLPGGRRGDLGYVAPVLRVADYAHINRERAPSFDRAFRGPISEDSLIHWLAQEHIDGPERVGGELIYRAARPIQKVDAWWLYYEMLSGLDTEIRAVSRYLERRASSAGRFSLQGVRGAASPYPLRGPRSSVESAGSADSRHDGDRSEVGRAIARVAG
jgi:hypothetical protein